MTEEDRDRRAYLTGFVLAAILTIIPFSVVWGQLLPRSGAILVLVICAIAQIIVQVRYFLHIDLSRQKREDLQVILFSSLLLFIMAAGTIWILGNLAIRMH